MSSLTSNYQANNAFLNEYVKDPKFKTEMCKNWEKTQSCPYFDKCRFAHGKHELMKKESHSDPNYRFRDCLSFFKYGSCNYGRRCMFKHDERKINESTSMKDLSLLLKLKNPEVPTKRLSVFEEISSQPQNNKLRESTSSYGSYRTCSTRHSSESQVSIKIKRNKKVKYTTINTVLNEIEDVIDFTAREDL